MATLFRSLFLVSLIALTGRADIPSSPCGTTASNRDLTGNWDGYTATGAVAAIGHLMQNGTAVTGGYHGTAATGHPGLVLTFIEGKTTIDGTAFHGDFTITEGSLAVTGHVDATLSADGNHLNGNYTQSNGPHGPFNLTRISGTSTLLPSSIQLHGAEGGKPVTDFSLMLYNCGGGTLTWQASATAATGNWLMLDPSNQNLPLAPGGAVMIGIDATPGTLKAKDGPLNGTVTVTAANASAATAAVVFTLGVDQIDLQASPSIIAFSGSAGGAPPASQSLTISSASGTAVSFAIATDGGQPNTPAPPWLSVSPIGGVTPALIIVTVDPTKLTANNYSARIVITVPSDPSQPPVYIAVSFTVASSPPKLDVSPRSLSFRATAQVQGALVRTILVRNIGGSGDDSFTVSVPAPVPGLSISPMSGQVSPDNPASIEVSIRAQAAAPGGSKGTIRFTSADTTIDVAISLFVANAGAALSVDQTGLLFTYRQGQGLQTPQVINVFDVGDSSSSVSFTADVANGVPWLSLSPTSGSATPAAPAAITATINANALQLGTGVYYALIRVVDDNAQNSPQYVAAVLNVLAASSPPQPDPFPRGLVFIASAGGAAPPSQSVKVYTSSQMPVNFTAAAAGAGGIASFLTVSPTSGSLTTISPAMLNINVSLAGLSAGVYRGTVNTELGAVERSVNVTLIIVPAGFSASRAAEQASVCKPTRVILTETGLPNGFAVPGGFPATLSAVMNDDCGNKITDGSAVANFSNGDPALSLVTDTSTGVYSTTWQPGGAAQTTVTMTGTSGMLAAGTVQITGTVSENPTPAPVLAPGGTVNNVFPGGSLSPGAVAAVFGSGLALNQGAPKTVPLPISFQGTSLLVGAKQAPLFFISRGQINAQIPSELEPGQYSVIVNVKGALSLPDTISVNSVQPAVVALADGHVIAQHANGKLVKASNPAKPGETVIIYLLGMGGTNPVVASGQAAPSSPLAKVVVQPVVTVDGQSAKVVFAGLTPGGVGLYQIDFKVPTSARTGDLDLVVNQNGVVANTTKLIVTK